MKPINCLPLLPRNFILKDGSELGERRYSNNNATSEGLKNRRLNLAFVFPGREREWVLDFLVVCGEAYANNWPTLWIPNQSTSFREPPGSWSIKELSREGRISGNLLLKKFSFSLKRLWNQRSWNCWDFYCSMNRWLNFAVLAYFIWSKLAGSLH